MFPALFVSLKEATDLNNGEGAEVIWQRRGIEEAGVENSIVE